MIELVNKFVNKNKQQPSLKTSKADYSTPFHTHNSKLLFSAFPFSGKIHWYLITKTKCLFKSFYSPALLYRPPRVSKAGHMIYHVTI